MSFLNTVMQIAPVALGGMFGGREGAMTGATVSSAFMNRQAQKEVNQLSMELANTSHQREMNDLFAAGLNPILTGKYGGSPSPNMTAPTLPDLGTSVSSISTAKAQRKVLEKQADKEHYLAEAAKWDAENKSLENAINLNAVPELKDAVRNSAKASSSENRVRAKAFEGGFGELIKYLQLLGPSINSGANVFRSFRP